MSERSYAGYTLDELEDLCMRKAANPQGVQLVVDNYKNAAMAALPFLIARIRQLDRRPRRAGERNQGRHQGVAR